MGLYALQHRGQESVGVVSIDARGDATAFRRMGTMTDGMAQEMERSPGVAAIGHTRYSTSGSSTLDNAQPMLARSRGGSISLAHNGNLTNSGELRAELEDQGSVFGSTNDSEVIVHRLARSTANKPEDRVAEALNGVEGAYSLIISLGNTLMAVRDPRGWRPLAMGKLGDAFVFASETCGLDIVGATYLRDVEPGEVVVVDNEGLRSTHPLPHKESRSCVFEYVYFARPDSRVFGGSVDRARRALGRRLAKEPPAKGADLVFSVPDSSNSAALGFAEESHLPYELALIPNHYVRRTFIQPTQAGRTREAQAKDNPVREVLAGKNVVMVDDSIVRGTTTRGLGAMGRAAGAKTGHLRGSSPPGAGPSHYGHATPPRAGLVA